VVAVVELIITLDYLAVLVAVLVQVLLVVAVRKQVPQVIQVMDLLVEVQHQKQEQAQAVVEQVP
jgi:hypothetical protein